MTLCTVVCGDTRGVCCIMYVDMWRDRMCSVWLSSIVCTIYFLKESLRLSVFVSRCLLLPDPRGSLSLPPFTNTIPVDPPPTNQSLLPLEVFGVIASCSDCFREVRLRAFKHVAHLRLRLEITKEKENHTKSVSL